MMKKKMETIVVCWGTSCGYGRECGNIFYRDYRTYSFIPPYGFGIFVESQREQKGSFFRSVSQFDYLSPC